MAVYVGVGRTPFSSNCHLESDCVNYNMARMDALIEEMLTEYEPRYILDEPIPEDVEGRIPRPLQPRRTFIDLNTQVPHAVGLSAGEPWFEILKDAKDEFEVDGAAAVST